MATIPAPTDVGALANRINFHTRDAHNKINAYMSVRLAFALKHGWIYRQGILAYYYVFQAIEQELDRIMSCARNEKEIQMQNILQEFWMDDFRRTDKIYQDLTMLYAPEFPTEFSLGQFLTSENQLAPTLQAFVDSIHKNVQEEPCTILSYCHVLYLALFAGGKVMRSNIYRHTGLFPKFQHLTPRELVKRGTNFFTFSDEGSDAENKLRWRYKRGYELATREELTEEQKQKIISVSSEIFQWNMDTISEIGELNRQELMGSISFKLITYLHEEWKHTDKLSKKQKDLLVLAVLVAQFLVVYLVLRRIFA
ncbi:hypothetical protein ZYGR_0AS05020 [Zygosaccharomyces rouxii]|uniref:Heme oxygenase n=1 Tax=Zygosaccharomyces rouxii TaxID=4956 RepID=A0A1Q3AHG5_ZYGRO|nr:hypothetical protein ZYGR_0AS05020 [Zygosaccharomyces rouxii]